MMAGGQSAAGAPVRFVLIVTGAWTVVRGASVWTPDAPIPVPVAQTRPTATPIEFGTPATPNQALPFPVKAEHIGAPNTERPIRTGWRSADMRVKRVDDHGWAAATPAPSTPPYPSWSFGPLPPARPNRAPLILAANAAPAFNRPSPAASLRRWRAEAYVYLRASGLPDAVEPSLGGSQALVAVRRELTSRVALSARLTSALAGGRARQSEVAVGVALRPARSLPLEVVAERRVALSADGRDAWQLRTVGGGQWESGGWRLEGYGQAGVVGTRARDLFGDAEVRLSRGLTGPLRAGVFLAGAAQPGASRIDIGPVLRADLPVGSASVSVLASYRVQVSGDAAPGSGPALTLATSF